MIGPVAAQVEQSLTPESEAYRAIRSIFTDSLFGEGAWLWSSCRHPLLDLQKQQREVISYNSFQLLG